MRYKDITQCSPGNPFERKLGNKNIFFTDPEKLVEFLIKSEKAAYMWTDSEDLAVLSDLYQIKIKIITSQGEYDENPTVNWIHPDKSMKAFAELKDVDMDEMVLFHQDDCHFNLVVNKESDLALKGSISQRFDVGPFSTIDDDIEAEVQKEYDNENDIDETIKDLKKELKKSRDSKNMIEKEYNMCEKELRNKTEEVEILKVEVKDLKEILKLKDEIEENEINNSKKEEDVLNTGKNDASKLNNKTHKKNNCEKKSVD